MIARSVVCCADSCQTKRNYATAYKQVNRDVPKSSPVEQVATGIALSVLCSGGVASYGSIAGQVAESACLGAWGAGSFVFALPCIEGTTVSKKTSEGFLSTGCIRDCKVLQQTFAKAELPESNSIDR